MNFSIADLMRDHREIEAALELQSEDELDPQALDRARELCARHYREEEGFLTVLRAHNPGLAAKLQSQHDEALEFAAALSVAGAADASYLLRRFRAIVQHNIIEEERDVFPWAERLS